MVYINRIELQGKVGAVRLNEVYGRQVVNFSLATEVMYRSNLGDITCELTWHNVVVWDDVKGFDMSRLQRGDNVRVVGRLRTTKYISADGQEKLYYEVIASKASIITE